MRVADTDIVRPETIAYEGSSGGNGVEIRGLDRRSSRQVPGIAR